MKRFIILALVLGLASTVMAYNAEEYIEKKAAGLVTAEKIGTAYILVEKRYSQTTGKAVQPVIEQLQIADLETRKIVLQAEIAAIDVLIADLEALNK